MNECISFGMLYIIFSFINLIADQLYKYFEQIQHLYAFGLDAIQIPIKSKRKPSFTSLRRSLSNYPKTSLGSTSTRKYFENAFYDKENPFIRLIESSDDLDNLIFEQKNHMQTLMYSIQ